MEETRIPLLSGRNAIDRIGNLLVEIVEHGQSILCLECVHQVLRGFVEVPSARPHAPATVQHVAPVGTAIEGVVVLIVGVLHGKDALLRVFVLGKEDVAKVLKVAILRLLYDSRVIDDFLHILVIDVADASIGLVAVAPSHCQVALCQIGSSGNLVGTSAFALLGRQHIVCKLEVGNNLVHQLLVCELVVGRLLLGVVLVNLFVHPRHLIPHLHELEVEVSAEEAYLTLTDSGFLLTQLVFAILGQRNEGAVAARDAAIEVIPLLVHVVGSRGSQCRPYFYGVVVGVGRSRPALHGIVAADVAIRPEVERIGVPVVAEFGVGRGHHFVGLAHGKVFADDTLRLDVDEIVAACEGCGNTAANETSGGYLLIYLGVHNYQLSIICYLLKRSLDTE